MNNIYHAFLCEGDSERGAYGCIGKSYHMEILKKKIIDYWHISRTALAGKENVPTRSDRIKYISDTLKKYDADLISDLSPKQLYFTILEYTLPTNPI